MCVFLHVCVTPCLSLHHGDVQGAWQALRGHPLAPTPPPAASPPQLLPAPPSRRAAPAATAPGHPRPRSVEPHAGTCPHLPVSAAPALSVLLLGPSHPPQDRSPRHHLSAAATRARTFEVSQVMATHALVRTPRRLRGSRGANAGLTRLF